MNNFKTNENTLGKILFIIGAIFLLISTYACVRYNGIWYDELYTRFIVLLPLNEAIDLILKDVHPFLYYAILKVFVKVFSVLSITDAVLVGRIVSLIPFYLLGVLSLTKIRKNFGILTTGIFFLCICSMPELMIYGVEIRMYSWGLFFVTTSFVYMYEIIKNPTTKNWVILTILTIASAYTHYFSAVASFIIYLLLLIYIIKNNKSLFKKWIISSIIAVLVFLPWTFVVMNQITNNTGNFWIAPIKINTVISYVYYILSPADIFIKGNELKSPTILGTIFILLFIYLIYKNRDKKFVIAGLTVAIGVPLIGILISLFFQPSYHARYIIPSLGCLWLAFSIMFSDVYNKNKKIFVALLCFVLLIGVIGTIDFINLQQEDQKETELTNQTISSVIGKNNVVLYNYFGPYVKVSSYYAPENTHIGFTGNTSDIQTGFYDSGIQEKIKNGAKVFFITSKLDDSYKNTNLTFTKIDVKFFIENDEFEIYEVTET